MRTKQERRERRLEKARRALRATVVGRLLGDPAILGRDAEAIAAAARADGRRAVAVGGAEPEPISELPPDARGPALREALERAGEAEPHSVVLDRVLEQLPKDEARRVLEAAWQRVPEGGRLLVVAANDDLCPEEASEREITRRELWREMKRLGIPRLVKSQPLKWLAMIVDRPSPTGGQLSRPVRERYRITSRLCRGRVLELGCGEGLLTGFIAARGLDVVGVELNERKVERGLRLNEDLDLRAGDILTVDLPAESFDTVVIAEVLEHVEEDVGERMLDRAWGWLAPGGRLVVSVPNEDCVPHANHVREWDRKSFRRMLKRWGRVRLWDEQPFKWLLATVAKPKHRETT